MDNEFIIRIPSNKEVVSEILAFCKKEGIFSAWIQGIGAVNSATLSSYNLDTKKYQRNNVEGVFELLNLTGNIGTLNGEITAHLHCTLADQDMKTYGGHLDKAVVSITCEVLITKINFKIERKFDQATGLNLINNAS